MCGRGRCTLRADDFRRACHLNAARPVRHLNMDRYRPSYNVAPGFNVPVVRPDEEGDANGVVLHCMKWGLIPSFTKKTEKIDHFRMFNARSESIREKASFRRLLPKNRCLVSFEGFYEWKKDGSRKQPYYIHFKDGRPLVFAALYDSWKSAEGEIIYTFTIITTSSSPSLEWLHDRMPVILGNKESTENWLNDTSLSNLDKILKPYEEKDLAWYPVTTAIGKLSFNGPECIKEIQVKTEETKTISQFFSKKDAYAPEPKCEKSPVKNEPTEASEPKIPKEEPCNVSTENTTLMYKPAEGSLQKSVKYEDENQLALKSTQMKDECVENSQEKSIKEEPKSQGKDEDQSTISKDNIDKRYYAKFCAHANESEKKHASPARKRNKGADDKQPTLFSYFGRC
ncbi:Unknown protein [Striga hermonthica]|uniref:Embryonic stem cell-specific 5-hydroxymethylcytosine-binding protein n=1 Tax=Striga hermonthica TaxID=68872 RepID=A0A9N7RS53_STRHE|nr:Unknown protein [Striga hermonthica]